MAATNHNTVDGCLPELVAAYHALEAQADGRDIIIRVADYGGVRDAETVAQLIAWRDADVAAGKPSYRVAPFAETKHAVGGAFDVKIVDPGPWVDDFDFLGHLAPYCGLVWGGTFPPPIDRRHFELPDSLEVLRSRWAEFRSTRNG